MKTSNSIKNKYVGPILLICFSVIFFLILGLGTGGIKNFINYVRDPDKTKDIYALSEINDLIQSGVSREVIDQFVKTNSVFRPGTEYLVISDSSKVTVYFETMQSLHGKWKGTVVKSDIPWLSLSPSQTSYTFLPAGAVEVDFSPSAVITSGQIPAESIHKTVTANFSMQVKYPCPALGVNTYTTCSPTIDSTVNFYTLAPDEMNTLVSALNETSANKDAVPLFIITLVCSILPLLLGIIVFIMIRKGKIR